MAASRLVVNGVCVPAATIRGDVIFQWRRQVLDSSRERIW